MRAHIFCALLVAVSRAIQFTRVQRFDEAQIRANYLEIASLVRSFGGRGAGARDGVSVVLAPQIDEAGARRDSATLLKRLGADGELLVARRGGGLVGFALVRDRTLEVVEVAPASRGGGVGKSLLAAAERAAASSGAPALDVEVEKYNSNGRRFFERNGYRETGRRRDLAILSRPVRRAPIQVGLAAAALAAAAVAGASPDAFSAALDAIR